jgi:hypothetical protein
MPRVDQQGNVHYIFGPPQPLWAHNMQLAFFLPALMLGAAVFVGAAMVGWPLVQGGRDE